MKSHAKTETKGRPRAAREQVRPATEEIAPTTGAWHWLTRAAFLLALALVIARATFGESLRDPFTPAPGAEAPPRGAGPAATLVLNLLACVPALLVLARRALDRSLRLRGSWATCFMAFLAAWALLSTFWAGDRFAAVVSASTLAAAVALLWAGSQLVRSWRRLRLVAGACLGLLLVFAGQGLYYKFADLPDFQRNFRENRAQILRERGLEEGTWRAKQFEQKALSVEQMGFSHSPNTFAAVIVFVLVVSMGVIAQRGSNRDAMGWAAFVAVAVLLGGYVIVLTDSKTAYVTPVLALAMLAALRFSRGWLAPRARLAYFAGVAAFLLGAAALVGHGLAHGSLVVPSLTFRWAYWVGSAKLFTLHPLAGVGWENFGPHYLGVRLAYPPEEIKDPHNFLVRFFVELGLVGGALAVGWVLRLWWELTRPMLATDADDRDRPTIPAIPVIATVAALAVLLNVAASVDFGQIGAYVALELIRRAAMFVLLLVGMAAVVLRSGADKSIDSRPAPWLLYGLLVALGLFLVHNLVDFSLFEAGPMFLFALGTGAALGMRTPPTSHRTMGRGTAFTVLLVGLIAWLIAVGTLAAPVALAEDAAHDADQAVRRAAGPGGMAEAARQFNRAFELVPYNADYAFRAAQALMSAGPPSGYGPAALQALAKAIAADPNEPGYYRWRAEYLLSGPNPDAGQVVADFSHALDLDPHNIPWRRRYAEVLERLNRPADAKRQYERVLEENDLLPLVEPARLPPEQIEQVRQKIQSSTSTTQPAP